ncbi:beta transducin-like protein [Sesbania bispinosa]|nr:beta transducin-like protein [Sesbania bispinosa]
MASPPLATVATWPHRRCNHHGRSLATAKDEVAEGIEDEGGEAEGGATKGGEDEDGAVEGGEDKGDRVAVEGGEAEGRATEVGEAGDGGSIRPTKVDEREI